jgi:hypothetical protein
MDLPARTSKAPLLLLCIFTSLFRFLDGRLARILLFVYVRRGGTVVDGVL